jgi:hypothetical protein
MRKAVEAEPSQAKPGEIGRHDSYKGSGKKLRRWQDEMPVGRVAARCLRYDMAPAAGQNQLTACDEDRELHRFLEEPLSVSNFTGQLVFLVP